MWNFVDYCFNESKIAVTFGEKASKAISSQVNRNRTVAAVNPRRRKEVGAKVDLLFGDMNRELGTGEAGRYNNINGTKSLEEVGMKLPKTIKGMFISLLED